MTTPPSLWAPPCRRFSTNRTQQQANVVVLQHALGNAHVSRLIAGRTSASVPPAQRDDQVEAAASVGASTMVENLARAGGQTTFELSATTNEGPGVLFLSRWPFVVILGARNFPAVRPATHGSVTRHEQVSRAGHGRPP
jgi:hypothetical protein